MEGAGFLEDSDDAERAKASLHLSTETRPVLALLAAHHHNLILLLLVLLLNLAVFWEGSVPPVRG